MNLRSAIHGVATGAALASCVACSDATNAPRDEAPVRLQAALSPGSVGSEDVPFSVGMDFGAGLDLVSNTVLSQTRCLDVSGAGGVVRSQPMQKEAWTFEVARDRSELRRLLDISAKLAGTVGPVRIGIEASYYDEMIRDSNSVYVVMNYDVITGSHSLSNPIMTLDGNANSRDGSVPGTVRYYYSHDYDAFRRMCGDRYLHTIETGGRYAAVLEIKTTSRYDKFRLAGELEGTYLPYMITVRGSLEAMLSDLKTNFQLRVHLLSRGDNRADNVVSLSDIPVSDDDQLEDLIEDVNRFKAAVLASARGAQAVSGYRMGPLHAKFASYEPTAHELHQGGFPTTRLEAMRAYELAFNEYEEVGKAAEEVLLRPERYQVRADGDLDVEALERESRLSREAIEAAAQSCSVAAAPVCTPVEQLGLTSADALFARLPAERPRYPRTCADVRELFDDDSEGEKQVYLGGKPEQPFWLYCANMEKTKTPEEYLSLPNHDPPTATPGTNFARGFAWQDAQGAARDTVNIYEKLRVHVNHDHLVVMPDQARFVTTDENRAPTDSERVPFGATRSCARGRQLGAVVDLRGTHFALGDNVKHQVREPAWWLGREPKSWFLALEDARARGGELMHHYDAREQQEISVLLAEAGLGNAWLGLVNSRQDAALFEWADGVATPYRNWAAGFPRGIAGSQTCGYVDIDGKWREGNCRSARPYVVETRKIRFDFDRSTPVAKLYVEARRGCGTVEANPELVLTYDSSSR